MEEGRKMKSPGSGEPPSVPFDASKLEYLDNLQKHLSWFLKTDEILLSRKDFAATLERCDRQRSPGDLVAVLHDRKHPRNFFNWISRAVGRERQLRLSDDLDCDEVTAEALGFRDVIVSSQGVKKVPSGRKYTSIHVYSLPQGKSSRKARLQNVTEIAKEHKGTAVYMYVTSLEREFFVWRHVCERLGREEGARALDAVRAMAGSQKGYVAAAQDLPADLSGAIEACRETPRLRELVFGVGGGEGEEEGEGEGEGPDLREFLQSTSGHSRERRRDLRTRLDEGRKDEPDLREQLHQRRESSDLAVTEEGDLRETLPRRSSQGRADSEGSRGRERERLDLDGGYAEDPEARSLSRGAGRKPLASTLEPKERYYPLRLDTGRIRFLQSWNSDLEAWSEEVWSLSRRLESDFVEAMKPCFKIQGTKQLASVIFLPSDVDKDLDLWKRRVESIFQKDSRTALGLVSDVSWNRQGRVPVLEMRSVKNHRRTVFLAQDPRELAAEDIPLELHSVYVTKFPEHGTDRLNFLDFLRSLLQDRQHWLRNPNMRITAFVSKDEYDFTFCHRISKHLSADQVKDAMALFRACQSGDQSEVDRLSHLKVQSNKCLADAAITKMVPKWVGNIFDFGRRGVRAGKKRGNNRAKAAPTSSPSPSRKRARVSASQDADVSTRKVLEDLRGGEDEEEGGRKTEMTMDELLREREALQRSHEEIATLRHRLEMEAAEEEEEARRRHVMEVEREARERWDAEQVEAMEREAIQREVMERQMREREAMEREMREREAMEREMREREAIEREMREREMREREMREREAMEREVREREAMEREMREREAMEKEMREREAMEREMGEREAMERDMREREVMERDMREGEAMEKEVTEREIREKEMRDREEVDRRSREAASRSSPTQNVPSSLYAYLVEMALRSGKGASQGEAKIKMWMNAGHTEATLEEAIRSGPQSANEIKLFLMGQLFKVPHCALPEGVTVRELVQETADFFLATGGGSRERDAVRRHRGRHEKMDVSSGRYRMMQLDRHPSHAEPHPLRHALARFPPPPPPRPQRTQRAGSTESIAPTSPPRRFGPPTTGRRRSPSPAPARRARGGSLESIRPASPPSPTTAPWESNEAVPKILSLSAPKPLFSIPFPPPPPPQPAVDPGMLLPTPPVVPPFPPSLAAVGGGAVVLPCPAPSVVLGPPQVPPTYPPGPGVPPVSRNLVQIDLSAERARRTPTPPPPGESEKAVVAKKPGSGTRRLPSLMELSTIRPTTPPPGEDVAVPTRRVSPARTALPTPAEAKCSKPEDASPPAAREAAEYPFKALSTKAVMTLESCHDDLRLALRGREVLVQNKNMKETMARCLEEKSSAQVVVVLRGVGTSMGWNEMEVKMVCDVTRGGKGNVLVVQEARSVKHPLRKMVGKNVVMMAGLHKVDLARLFPAGVSPQSVHVYNLANQDSARKQRKDFLSALSTVWTSFPKASVYLYLSAQHRDFAVWRHVKELHGAQAANRAVRAVRHVVDLKRPPADGSDDALVSCEISPRVRNLVIPAEKASVFTPVRAASSSRRPEEDKEEEGEEEEEEETEGQQGTRHPEYSSLFRRSEWEGLKKSVFDMENPLEVAEFRVNRDELEERLRQDKEALLFAQSTKVVVVFTFTEKAFEAVQRVGQAKVLDCRSGYINCSEENLAEKHFVALQPSAKRDVPNLPPFRAHAVHVVDIPDKLTGQGAELLSAINKTALSNPQAPVYLYAGPLERDFSVWRYMESTSGAAAARNAVKGLRLLARGTKALTRASRQAIEPCLRYAKLRHLFPADRQGREKRRSSSPQPQPQPPQLPLPLPQPQSPQPQPPLGWPQDSPLSQEIARQDAFDAAMAKISAALERRTQEERGRKNEDPRQEEDDGQSKDIPAPPPLSLQQFDPAPRYSSPYSEWRRHGRSPSPERSRLRASGGDRQRSRSRSPPSDRRHSEGRASPSVQVVDVRAPWAEGQESRRSVADPLASISKEALQSVLRMSTATREEVRGPGSSSSSKHRTSTGDGGRRGERRDDWNRRPLSSHQGGFEFASFSSPPASAAWSSTVPPRSPTPPRLFPGPSSTMSAEESRPVFELASLKGATRTADSLGTDPGEEYRRLVEEREWRVQAEVQVQREREEEGWRQRWLEMQDKLREEALQRWRKEQQGQHHQGGDSPAMTRSQPGPRGRQGEAERAPAGGHQKQGEGTGTAGAGTAAPPAPARPARSNSSKGRPEPSPEALTQWTGLHDYVVDKLLDVGSMEASQLLSVASAVRRAMATSGLRRETLTSWLGRSGPQFVSRVVRAKLAAAADDLAGALSPEDAADLVVRYLQKRMK